MSEARVTREEAIREVLALLTRAGRAPREQVLVATHLLIELTEPDNTVRRLLLDCLLASLRQEFNLPATQ
jgi:hypothetical protein